MSPQGQGLRGLSLNEQYRIVEEDPYQCPVCRRWIKKRPQDISGQDSMYVHYQEEHPEEYAENRSDLGITRDSDELAIPRMVRKCICCGYADTLRTFAPGHDAKLESRIKEEIRTAEDTERPVNLSNLMTEEAYNRLTGAEALFKGRYSEYAATAYQPEEVFNMAEDTIQKTETKKSKTGTCLFSGEPTKGGNFRPGYDAKLKGVFVKEITAAETAERPVNLTKAMKEAGVPDPRKVMGMLSGDKALFKGAYAEYAA